MLDGLEKAGSLYNKRVLSSCLKHQNLVARMIFGFNLQRRQIHGDKFMLTFVNRFRYVHAECDEVIGSIKDIEHRADYICIICKNRDMMEVGIVL